MDREVLEEESPRDSGRTGRRRPVRHGTRRRDDAADVLDAHQEIRAQGRHQRAALAAYAASCLRHAPAQSWRRPARGTASVRALGYFHHADLYARGEGAIEEAACGASSAWVRI